MTETPEKSGAERRIEPRIESVTLVNYSVLETGEDEVDSADKIVYRELGTARTEDLSLNGCLLYVPRRIPAGVSLRLHLQIGEDIVKIEGRTRHAVELESGEWTVGIEFEDLSKSDDKKLGRFVRYLDRMAKKTSEDG